MTHLKNHHEFEKRHIGINELDVVNMLETMNYPSVAEFLSATIPDNILMTKELDIPEAMTEYEYLAHIKTLAAKNKVFKSYIGQGYYNTITPSPILRNIFENPGWYTQYTPYQAEIAQGRLESLLNYQTMVSDLTGMPLANASLLDEATSAAEAMIMVYGQKNKRVKGEPINTFFVDTNVFAHTKDVLYTRAIPLGINIEEGNWAEANLDGKKYFGALLQYPNSIGDVIDYKAFGESLKAEEVFLCVAADLLSLSLLKPPGEWGADVVVGSTQRFGVPLGYGGPHAAYFATSEKFKRQIPGRIIGVSIDADGNPALRMALQTREQHIKREKATSNICTAQALLANIAAMYAVYHGKAGIKHIAEHIHSKTKRLATSLNGGGYSVLNVSYFDTITVQVPIEKIEKIRNKAIACEVNFFYSKDILSISLDETTTEEDLHNLFKIFDVVNTAFIEGYSIPASLHRTSSFLDNEVFKKYQTETTLMRYIKKLENKDLSLVHSMIALGSCTMKLNAATQLMPLSWDNFSQLHPFVPIDQAAGYQEMFSELKKYLAEITGFTACSLQPNSGAQGEYAGLMSIRAYHLDRGDNQRNIVIIPSSAHGTNPASGVMCGMKIVVVGCDKYGNIDVDELRAKAIEYKDSLSALMITYPSTHGVFESSVKEICQIIHDNGGLVYMDGANMNAQVGYTSPGLIGADVCHLNLHKTFAIPHGGGGPGMGPICVNDKLAPFLPGHVYESVGGEKAITAVSAAPNGSSSILLISYAYIKMLGASGLKHSTAAALINANYIKARLEKSYSVLFQGENGNCAHELIIDINPFKSFGIGAEDVAKRLIDYGFHAPTMSFPVVGTIMIEPTESEDKEEIDIFCDALLSIKKEIDEVMKGDVDSENNVLRNAPHTLKRAISDDWKYPYSREKACYPLPYLRSGRKFWPEIARVDNAYGDRNLICTCPSVESYMEV